MFRNIRQYNQQDLELVDKQIETVKQQIEFERSTFGHAYPENDSPRVQYLLDDLQVLHKQRAVIVFFIRQSK